MHAAPAEDPALLAPSDRDAAPERLAALVEAAPDAIVTEDVDGVVVSWNPAAVRMFGIPAPRVVGRSFDTVVLASAERPAYVELRRRAREGETVTARLAARRGDGSLFPVQVSLAPLHAPDGVVAIVRDITELVETELELRERAGRLERSNADLEQFAYTASHDLQAPLRSITMGAETVLHSAGQRLDDDEMGLLTHVVTAATRLSAQVTALMELAQVALGDEPGEPVPVALPLDDAVDALRVPIAEAAAEVDVAGTLPDVPVPRVEMALVLQNLIANAIAYRRADVPPRVTVSGAVVDGSVAIRVSDNGVGLTEADRVHIFSIFGRVEPDVPGTGLGLALCRRILERRGGSISVSSPGPGHGSCFTVSLPARAPAG